MLDAIKRKELNADLATLEVGAMNPANYEKLMVLKLLRLIDDAERYAEEEKAPPRRKNRRAVYSSAASSEFTAAIAGKDMDEVIQIMDELMETLKAVNERAYADVMRKINAL